MRIRIVVLVLVVFLLGGCASSRLTRVIADPGVAAQPLSRLLVLGPPGMVERESFEQRFAIALSSVSGVAAVAGSPALPEGRSITPAMIDEAARSVGADGVLTVVPVETLRIHHPPPGYYGLLYDFQGPGWFSYGVPVMDFQVLRLEIGLYPLEGRQPRWRALSETVDPTPALPAELAALVGEDPAFRRVLHPDDLH